LNDSATSPADAKRSVRRICIGLAAVYFLLHLWVNAFAGYGYFRDEFYYVACSGRLAAGYVDLPPLSMYILALQRALAGDSVFALRLFPALAGSVLVYLTGTLAARMGARRFGVALACLACACSPVLLAFSGSFSMNAFDVLVWIGAAHLFASLLERPRLRLWIALGVLCGLGMLNKINVSWLVLGIFVGLVATPQRSLLRQAGPWVAAAIALVLFSPFVIWNVQHDYAHLEFIRNASTDKYSGLSPLTFLRGQLTLHHPLNVPIWIAGLYFLFFSRAGKAHRPLGYIWLTACVVLLANGTSKSEYLSGAFPILFAAGGAASELLTKRWFALAVRPVYALLLLLSALALVPIVLPVLPVESYISYAQWLGIKPSTSENKELSRLPQGFADMHGWPEKVEAVVRAFERLTPQEQADCAIFASNYGRCGALDMLGKARGLPASIGNHNNYWIWGPRDYSGAIVLVLDKDIGSRAEFFESVEIVDSVADNPYAMPYENGLKVILCRGLKQPLAQAWPALKHYD
jgi:hypothetical protein